MYSLNCKGKLLMIDQPVVMGIINTTPDSFFGGSRQASIDGALRQAERMLNEGAALLDIGGQSTRPGAQAVDAATEISRVVPVMDALSRHFPEAIFSVDTYYATVAREAVAAGAGLVNDVSGGMWDEAMLATVAGLGLPYVCMHSRGRPDTMQQNPQYADVTREVLDFFIERMAACKAAGINDVVLDPGIGFGKTAAHNFQLIRQLNLFQMLDAPLLLGVSRKGLIYKTLGVGAEEALNGSTVLHAIGLMKGASILRVHDVKEAVEAVKLVQAVGG